MSSASLTVRAESWQGVGEMPLDYRAYIRDFNSGDDRGLVEKYFTADTQMISGSCVRDGHKGMNEFLAWAHDGVREHEAVFVVERYVDERRYGVGDGVERALRVLRRLSPALALKVRAAAGPASAP